MINKLIIFMMFSTYAISANTLSPSNDAKKISSKNFIDLLKDYQNAYALHDKNIEHDLLSDLKTEITNRIKGFSTSEKKAHLAQVAVLIPNEDERYQFLELIAFSSEQELLELATSANSLTHLFQGEGADFSFDTEANIGLGVVSAIFVGILAASIIKDYNTDVFNSSDHVFISKKGEFCTENQVEIDIVNRLKLEAKAKCLDLSTRPDTCKYDGFDSSHSWEIINNREVKSCTISARYKSKN